MSTENAQDSVLVWKALADPSRRRILDLLAARPSTTGHLCKDFELTRFAIMKHLTVLEEAGLIRVERRGRERWNHIERGPLRRIVARWLEPGGDTTSIPTVQGHRAGDGRSEPATVATRAPARPRAPIDALNMEED